MEERLIESIIKQQLENTSYECDRTIKDKAINWFRQQALKDNYIFTLDEQNNNTVTAKTDIMFTLSKDNKVYKFAVELKQRKHLVGDYEDEMFEINKFNTLKQLSEEGYKVYFLNVFADGYSLLFDVLNPSRKGFAFTYDSTVKARPDSPKTKKEKLYYSVTDEKIIKAKFLLK